MKEVCIPIPHFGEQQIAEVEVTVNGKKKQYNFRIESFPWSVNPDEVTDTVSQTEVRINNLRNMLDNYDNGWELVQIFTPRENSDHIQVLFRQRK
ncbi:hypothetical protein ACFLS9_00145 [Bacteroidota bacterium]